MIKEMTPLSSVESLEYTKFAKDEGKEVNSFIKKFVKLKEKDAKELKKEIGDLKLVKIDSKEISKIVDFAPESEEELNKITVGLNLNEEESSKILDLIKRFK